ncbi:SDR family NAD(P)-dependent oxidoreductase [uncultured Pseudoteredinibacter sp.]|uniref:SDR family NAD(P)-dependent oxidoreductase n=1 Tax=uncultured Pseudoteredinibacter sp. TaxID=1641701 RepID=UPI00260168E4|nr:SDR family NAD(P)-dependent oxidoreductase [uncultured Pseudoteredinibacter sp.]
MKETPNPIRLAVLGCGDIGLRLINNLQGQANGYAFSRSPKDLPDGFEWRQANAGDVHSYGQYLEALDVLLITLTPADRGDEAYRLAYVEPIRQLVEYASTLNRCPLLMFVSSTAVYGQDETAILDDDSAAVPTRYNGIRMLEAENLLANSGLPHCVVRFSGIYGLERKRLFSKLVQEVREEKSYIDSDAHWGNRIHIEDCVAVLEHLLKMPPAQREAMYLASDSEPSLRGDIKSYLASLLPSELPARYSCNSATGKRLFPKRLLASSYKFKYPTYREGYQAQLEEYLAR